MRQKTLPSRARRPGGLVPQRGSWLALVGSIVWAAACSGGLSDPSFDGAAAGSFAPGTEQPGGVGPVGGASETPGVGDTGAPGVSGTSTPGLLPTEPNPDNLPEDTMVPGGGGTGVASDPLPPVEAEVPSPVQWKRLTSAQFSNTLAALLNVPGPFEVEDEGLYEFSTVDAGRLSSSPRAVKLYWNAIRDAVNEAFADSANVEAIAGCTPGATECDRQFVQEFGRLAWRRPLTPEEEERHVAVSRQAAASLDAVSGLRLAAEALLNSPYFLYRAEFGEPTETPDVLRYTDYDMASRLAFFVTNQGPDAELLNSAAAGALGTPDEVRQQVSRLLEGEHGTRAITGFAEELFHLRALPTKAKDQSVFPEYDQDLIAAMSEEVKQDWAFAMTSGANALTLFNAREATVNGPLARLYGIDAPDLDENTFERRALPSDGPRAGLLGKAAVHSLFANQQEGSPTLRGIFVREQLLCQPIPPPPPGVQAVVPPAPQGVVMTKRERLDQHRSDPVCAGCHALMDPLGYPLEHFDAIGRYRDTDSGKPVDASGSLDGVAFDDLSGLAQLLSESEQASLCLVQNLYTYATGVAATAEQKRTYTVLAEQFAQSGNQLSSLVNSIVTSDAFRLGGPPSEESLPEAESPSEAE